MTSISLWPNISSISSNSAFSTAYIKGVLPMCYFNDK
jgi:hypothetical protein